MMRIEDMPFEKDQYLILYGNIVPVKGARRSTLCDTHREEYHLIPNALYELVSRSREMSIGELMAWGGAENEVALLEYFHFLLEKELAMVTDDPQCFPAISLQWKSPLKLTNAIIDIAEDSNHDLVNLATQLSDLGCQAVELRVFFPADLNQLRTYVSAFDGTRIKCLELLTQYQPSYSVEDLQPMMRELGRFMRITISGAPEVGHFTSNGQVDDIHVIRQVVDSAACCGFVNPQNFSVNITMVTESTHANSCLNRKIGIDVAGNLKNCPSSVRVFGHVKTTPLQDVLLDEAFTAGWKITKDQVEVCQDCEFRKICVDCRIFTEDSDNPFAKPARCGYDPYQAQWVKGKSTLKSTMEEGARVLQ